MESCFCFCEHLCLSGSALAQGGNSYKRIHKEGRWDLPDLQELVQLTCGLGVKGWLLAQDWV